MSAQNNIVTYSVTPAQIREMRSQYSGLTFDTPAAYEEGRVALAVLRKTRTSIEARREELKADSLEFGRRVDGAAKELTAAIEEIEKPLAEAKRLVDEEKARVKREKEEAARAAIAAQLRAEQEAADAIERAEREANEAADAIQRAEREANEAATREALRLEADRVAAERVRLDEEREALRQSKLAEQSRIAAEERRIENMREIETAKLSEERRALEAEQARLRAWREDEQARVEGERRAAERAAQAEALKPDIEKLRDYVNALHAVTIPHVRSQQGVTVAREVARLVDEAIETIEELTGDIL